MLGMCHHSSVCPDWDGEAARSRARGGLQLPGRLNGVQSKEQGSHRDAHPRVSGVG